MRTTTVTMLPTMATHTPPRTHTDYRGFQQPTTRRVSGIYVPRIAVLLHHLTWFNALSFKMESHVRDSKTRTIPLRAVTLWQALVQGRHRRFVALRQWAGSIAVAAPPAPTW